MNRNRRVIATPPYGLPIPSFPSFPTKSSLPVPPADDVHVVTDGCDPAGV